VLSASSVRVQWCAPFDGHSPLLRYELQYRRVGSPSAACSESASPSAGGVPAVVEVERERTSALLAELAPATRYEWCVVAVNAIGSSHTRHDAHYKHFDTLDAGALARS
jgi:hypothetical protein